MEQCARGGEVQVLQGTEIGHSALAVASVLHEKIRLSPASRSKGPDQTRRDGAFTICNHELSSGILCLDLIQLLSVPERQIGMRRKHISVRGTHERPGHRSGFLGSRDFVNGIARMRRGPQPECTPRIRAQ